MKYFLQIIKYNRSCFKNYILILFFFITANIIECKQSAHLNSISLRKSKLAPNSQTKNIFNENSFNSLIPPKLSFLTLFCERGYFNNIKYFATYQIGNINNIPLFYIPKIKSIFLSNLQSTSIDLSLMTIITAGKLLKKNIFSIYDFIFLFKEILAPSKGYIFAVKKEGFSILYNLEYINENEFLKIQELIIKGLEDPDKNIRNIAYAVLMNLLLKFEYLKKSLNSNIIKAMSQNYDIVNSDIFSINNELRIPLYDKKDVIKLAQFFEKDVMANNDYSASIRTFINLILPGFTNFSTEIFSVKETQFLLKTQQKTIFKKIEQIDASFSNFFSQEADKIEKAGRNIKIHKSNGDIIIMKIRLNKESEESFEQEASLMIYDKRLSMRFKNVNLLNLNAQEILSSIDLNELVNEIHIKNKKIQVIKYTPEKEYLLYGEEVLLKSLLDEKIKIIDNMIKAWIFDLFYFINTYGIFYFDFLPLFHDIKTHRYFSIEQIPIGEIDKFDLACIHSNLRLNGIADFNCQHYYIFQNEIDMFSLWFIIRYQLLQLILKTANLVYKSQMDFKYLEFFLNNILYSFFNETLKSFNVKNNFILQFDTKNIVQELGIALELCYLDNIYPLKKKIRN